MNRLIVTLFAAAITFLFLTTTLFVGCSGCADVQQSEEAVLALGTSFEATGLAADEALVRVDSMRFPNARQQPQSGLRNGCA